MIEQVQLTLQQTAYSRLRLNGPAIIPGSKMDTRPTSLARRQCQCRFCGASSLRLSCCHMDQDCDLLADGNGSLQSDQSHARCCQWSHPGRMASGKEAKQERAPAPCFLPPALQPKSPGRDQMYETLLSHRSLPTPSLPEFFGREECSIQPSKMQ